MGKIAPISGSEAGCPSGLQDIPVAEQDPLGARLDLSSFVQEKDGMSSLDLIVQGAHCGGCMNKIERGLAKLPGVTQARMNLSTMRLHVDWKTDALGPESIIQTLGGLGYGAAPYAANSAQAQSQSEIKTLLRALAVAGFAMINVMLLSVAIWAGGEEMSASTHKALHWVSAIIALPAVAFSGRVFFKSAWNALKNKHTNMDVPISLAVILACALSIYETVKGNPDTYFDAAVMLLFLLLIGRYLDAKLRQRTGEAAQRLAAMQVTSATRQIADGGLETVPASLIKAGDILLIPTGQRVPVDAEIITGSSEIDTQIVTGETVPRLSGPGDMLYSGTVNLTAPLTVRAVAVAADSFLSEITQLVEAGEQSKSKFVKIADRAARAYVPVVHTLAVLTFVGWLLAGASLRPAALNAIAVLIITCPCALGLAVPAVQVVAAGRLFKKGVLIKSGDALERLAQIRWAVFDKTGTLTTGQLKLENRATISVYDLEIAAALAAFSKHPIAKALHAFKGGKDAINVQEVPGEGLYGTVDGKTVSFGKPSGVKAVNTVDAISWLTIGDAEPVEFIFKDKPRKEAKETVAALKAMGLTTELLSGDRAETAKNMGAALGFDRARGDVSPKEKQSILYQRAAEGRLALMVGDGINDAPALAAAHASASLVNASDISRAASDIILQGDNLSAIPAAIQTARQAQLRVIENLGLAVIYNLCAIPLAIFGYVNPLIAALAMSGSSLLVMLNALRLMRD